MGAVPSAANGGGGGAAATRSAAEPPPSSSSALPRACDARLTAAQRGWRTRRALRSRAGAALAEQLHDVRAMLVELSAGAPSGSGSAGAGTGTGTGGASSYETTMCNGLRGQIRKQVCDLVSLCTRPLAPARQHDRPAAGRQRQRASVSFADSATAGPNRLPAAGVKQSNRPVSTSHSHSRAAVSDASARSSAAALKPRSAPSVPASASSSLAGSDDTPAEPPGPPRSPHSPDPIPFECWAAGQEPAQEPSHQSKPGSSRAAAARRTGRSHRPATRRPPRAPVRPRWPRSRPRPSRAQPPSLRARLLGPRRR